MNAIIRQLSANLSIVGIRGGCSNHISRIDILESGLESFVTAIVDDLLLDIKGLKGEMKVREVKTRVNQNVFRQIVISNYSGKCAISGIDESPDIFYCPGHGKKKEWHGT